MKKQILLTRDQFRESVFERDHNKCVMCDQPAQDAHHIIERRLWPDSGYYIDNGASLCGEHHIMAETTQLSCDEIRLAAKIDDVILPPHLYRDHKYDKWGNVILDNGSRLKGELFHDESVQKILLKGDMLRMFTDYVKYSRTHHLPWSPGRTKDDRVIKDLSAFQGQDVIVTVKMDGENTSLYSDYIHARSIDFTSREDRTWIKMLHDKIKHEIPKGWRFCGENMFATHTIHYRDLESYFYLFSIWDEKNDCLPWEDTVQIAGMIGIKTVPILYEGTWNEDVVKKIYTQQFQWNECEGYVIRIKDRFNYIDFKSKVAKYVRAGHVGTHRHWTKEKIVPNELAQGVNPWSFT